MPPICEKSITTTVTTTTSTTTCPVCDENAEIEIGFSQCVCKCLPGWVGPGFICGVDDDADGWSDNELNCTEERFAVIWK